MSSNIYATSALQLTDTYVNTLPYGICNDTAETVDKTVSAGSFSRDAGATVNVMFSNTNTTNNPTLNVSSTGKSPIYYKGAAIPAGYIKAGRTYTFIYRGNATTGYWDLIGELEADESMVKLKETLYTYAPIGMAQKASNKVIGTTGSTISNTNPGKIANQGDSLKDVFKAIFGEERDQEPSSIEDTRKITYSYTSEPTLGSSNNEVGTSISTTSITITVTASGSCSSTYGYYTAVEAATGKPSTMEYGSGKTLTYTVSNQTISNQTYKLKLILPKNYYKTGNSGETTVTVNPAPVYVDGATIYINAASATITVPNTFTTQTASNQIIYNAIKASCKFDALKDSNGTPVLGFLTYQKNSANVTTTITNALSTKTIADRSSDKLQVSQGSYYNYYLASESNKLSNDINNPVTTATQFTSSSVKIPAGDTAKHIWFLLPPSTTETKTIQYEPFANTWVDAFGGETDITVGPVDVALELYSNASVMYKGYYTSAKAAAYSNLNYKIV